MSSSPESFQVRRAISFHPTVGAMPVIVANGRPGTLVHQLLCMGAWIRDRGLTLVLLAMFAIFLAAQLVTGHHEYNAAQQEHHRPAISMGDYLRTGHPWEAIFENWE